MTERAAAQWGRELDDLLITVGRRFGRVELRRRMRDYVRGLLAPVARKNSWQLAEQAGHATPDGLQHLLAGAKWQPDDVRDDLQQYVADQLGEDDGVLVIDDTGFIKKGTTSAGVQRQYSGTAGRTENCQIGVFAAYASRRGRVLVDRELYLPKSWTEDQERCHAAKIPDGRGFATKGQLAAHIVLRALASSLPITWVTADSAYGQEDRFRRLLEQSGVGYVLAVPKSQFAVGCPRIDHLFAQAPAEAWQKLSCGEGAKGPRIYHWAAVRLPAVEEFDYQGDVPFRMRWRWPAAACPARMTSPTTSPTAPCRSPSRNWCGSPGRGGPSRSVSRRRRTNAGWTSTKSAVTWAGTGTSRWPCSPTPSWPSPPTGQAKRGRHR